MGDFSNFWQSFTVAETRVLYGADEFFYLSFRRFDAIQQCDIHIDGRRDGWTDGRFCNIAKTGDLHSKLHRRPVKTGSR